CYNTPRFLSQGQSKDMNRIWQQSKDIWHTQPDFTTLSLTRLLTQGKPTQLSANTHSVSSTQCAFRHPTTPPGSVECERTFILTNSASSMETRRRSPSLLGTHWLPGKQPQTWFGKLTRSTSLQRTSRRNPTTRPAK